MVPDQLVSDFADGAVLLPATALVGIVLAARGWWRGLAAWLGCTCAAFLLVALLKAAALLVMNGDPGALSPSGHVAGAVALYAGLAMLLLHGRVPAALLAVPPLLVALVVGLSRLHLHAHTPLEVVIGALVGGLGAAALVVLAGPRPARLAVPSLVVLALAVLSCRGLHLDSEPVIIHTVAEL